jgi:head-tail adaptor
MNPSLLNKFITIERGIPSINSVGTPVLIWENYLDTYAGVYVPSQDIKYSSNGELFALSTEFTIRYNAETKEINNKYRISYDGDYYKILQKKEIGIKEGWKLICIAFDNE